LGRGTRRIGLRRGVRDGVGFCEGEGRRNLESMRGVNLNQRLSLHIRGALLLHDLCDVRSDVLLGCLDTCSDLSRNSSCWSENNFHG
jgi:hypothetical protein